VSEVRRVSGKGKPAVPRPGQTKLSSQTGPGNEPKNEGVFNPEQVIGAIDYDNVVHGDPNPTGSKESLKEISEININVKSKGKAKIVKIEEGLLKDFIPLEKLKNQANADRKAYRLTLQTEDGRTFRETVALSVSPNSKLRKLIERYGTLKVGTEVEYAEDARGWPRLVY